MSASGKTGCTTDGPLLPTVHTADQTALQVLPSVPEQPHDAAPNDGGKDAKRLFFNRDDLLRRIVRSHRLARQE